MGLIYQFGLLCYLFIAKVIAPFNLKAKRWSEGQKLLIQRIENDFKDNKSPVAWFHAASLGEFEQGRAVIEKFRAKYPHFKVVITFFSPSGYEVRKNYDGADKIYYLPLDTRANSRRFLEALKPEVAIFIKYEFWVNYLKGLKKRGVKTYLISSIFRPSQTFFKSYGASYCKVLKAFSHIFVQNNSSKELLQGVGIENVTVCGDTRFDRVYSIAQSSEKMELFENFAHGHKVFICGSSWMEDDEIFLHLIASFPTLRFILAPHELGEAKIRAFVARAEALGKRCVRYKSLAPEQKSVDCDVLVIDTIGILSKVYRYGTYGFIGGGFGVGIHNTLEAATFGLPLIFGPNYKRFAEALALVDLGVARSISSKEEAQEWLQNLLDDEDLYCEQHKKCANFVAQNVGACDAIINHPLL